MKLKEIISCYSAKVYECERSTFDKSVSVFQDHANPFENDWRESTKLNDKVIFKKGASICPTFTYSGPILEVKAIFKFDSTKQLMTVSVGNSGFPFEPLMSKQRYISLMENIHKFLIKSVDIKEKIA